MSVRVKLVVIILFVALVPLVVSAFTALRIHGRAYDDTVADLHRASADSGALWVDERFDAIRRNTAGVSRAIPWARASAEEREGALWLLYQQSDDIAVASLFDHRDSGPGRSAFVDKGNTDPAFSRHPPASVDTLARFYEHMPFSAARADGYAIGSVFVGLSGEPLLPIGVRVEGEGGQHWTVGVAVSLAGLCTDARSLGGADTEVAILDAEHRRICHPSAPVLSPAAGQLIARVSKPSNALFEYRDDDRRALLAASARTSNGWSVVAQQPAHAAVAASSRMRWQTAFWVLIAALAALAAGMFMARSIARPVRQLSRGARELAGGNLSYRVQVDSADELGGLASAFNQMSEEIEQRNAEIEAFNLELQQRVDDRTRQLKDAQQQLLRSQKLAAMSSLAAGVAHEINNPLTGVLGMAQLLKLRAPDDEDGTKQIQMLERIEGEATRIRDIVQTMLSLSEEQGGQGYREVSAHSALSEALQLVSTQLDDAGISLEQSIPDELPDVLGNRAQLIQVFVHLLNNAVTAMDEGGSLTVHAKLVEDELIELEVADTGRGIPAEHLERVFEPFFTTKEEWQGRGLGLSVAFRIVEQHNGSIAIDSKVGSGTAVTVTLPVAKGGAHLV